ncbi:MAG TPA: hypothetical protein IAC57_06250 [Candidatus Scatosoma pullistercoris]|uniref:Uncharacterized protein n=1 Tax=Candidatus Scatosoma pullistercoris TaxID=2840934 RepID=A0A9D1MGD6_9FIRM|nr:hypothetical protein [Candidatus Scatosoma pullistercoris]
MKTMKIVNVSNVSDGRGRVFFSNPVTTVVRDPVRSKRYCYDLTCFRCCRPCVCVCRCPCCPCCPCCGRSLPPICAVFRTDGNFSDR